MRPHRVLASTLKVIAQAAWLRLYQPQAFKAQVQQARDDHRRLSAELDRARQHQHHQARDQGEMRHPGDTADPREWGDYGT